MQGRRFLMIRLENNMVPTRSEIIQKIDKITHEKSYSGSKEQIIREISVWLDTLTLPETIIVAGREVNPKEQILADLPSYGV